jgi:hypothetical protein
MPMTLSTLLMAGRQAEKYFFSRVYWRIIPSAPVLSLPCGELVEPVEGS